MKQFESHQRYFIWVCVFLGVVTTLFNYSFGDNDHIEQLPIIYRTLDPNYLTNDFFVNSTAGFSPRYYYAQFVAFFGSFLSIPLFFFIGTLMSNVAISILTFRNAMLLLGNQRTAITAALSVMVFPTLHLGGDSVLYGSMFTPTTLVFPLILLAFYFFLKRRMLLCFMITGIASVFHILIGLEYGLLFLFTWMILDFLKQKNLNSILNKLPYLLIIIVFSLPNLIPYFQSRAPIDDSLFIEILAYYRHPHHYVLSEILTKGELISLSIVLLIIVLTWKTFQQKVQNKEHSKSIAIITVLLCGAVLLNWIFVELIPVKEIVSLQLLRLLNFGKWIFLLLVVHYLNQNPIGKGNKPREIIVFVGFILLWGLSGLSAIKMPIFLGVGLLIFYLLFTQKTTFLVSCSLLIVAGILLLNFINVDALQPYQKNYFSISGISENQREVSEFIKSHTDEDAVFLAPSLFGFLRVETKRALVVDYKAFPFQELAMKEWYERIEACYGLKYNGDYLFHSDETLRNLSRKYKADYAILFIQSETKIPGIYSNSEYKIIDLRPHAQ
jgi:hypothetical protein